MPAIEYMQWSRYYAEEPFGEVRADLRAGVIASTFANVMRGKRGKAMRPMDFMPIVRQQQMKDVPQALELRQAFESGLGGKVRRLKIKRSN